MAQELSPNSKPRILIVDDSRIVRATIIKRIKDVVDIREDVDGEEGWHTLVMDPTIQLLISDLMMPKLDGYGLLERVRASKINRIHNLPVIIISGDEDESARTRARELGASDFITKGMNAVEMISRIQAVVPSLKEKERRKSEVKQEEAALKGQLDPVTGLPTLEVLVAEGGKTFADAKKRNQDIAVLQLALDNFKTIAARYGDKVSERMRALIAKMLLSKMRKDDMVVAIVDDRFAIFSLSTSTEATLGLAKRLCETVASSKINYRGATIKLTASIGLIDTAADDVETLEEALTLAEGRMQRAQSKGGNQVITEGNFSATPPSLEEALSWLENGDAVKVEPHLEHLLSRLIPLLKLCSQELGEDAIAKIARKI